MGVHDSDRRSRLATAAVIAVLALASGVAVGALANALSSKYGYVAGLAGFFGVGGAIIARYASAGRVLSPLSMVTGLFILEFAAGAIFYHHPRRDSVLGDLVFAYTPGSLEIALLISFGAFVVLVAGYVLGGGIGGVVGQIPRPSVNDSVTGVAILLFIVGWAARALMVRNGWYFHITDGTPAVASGWRNIVVVIAGLPLIATGMIGARYYRERPTAKGAFWALVVVEVAWTVPSGERSRLIALGLLLIVLRAHSSDRRFPVGGAIALALVAVLVVFPLGAAYRTSSGTVTGYQSDPIGQLSGAASQTIDNYLTDPAAAVSGGLSQTVRRFAGVTSVAAMVHQGTEKYPADPSEALGIYGGAVVPRALLPGKGDASTLTVDFGRDYRIIAPGNTASVTMTSIGDLWGTFGPLGLVAGMLVIGVLVRAMAAYFWDIGGNYAAVAIYGAILGPFLLGFETSIAVGFLQTLRELAIDLAAVAIAGAFVRSIAVSSERGATYAAPSRHLTPSQPRDA